VQQLAALPVKQAAARSATPAVNLPAPPPAAPVQRVASHGAAAHGTVLGGWVAQLGVYAHMAKARTEAVAVQQMRGVGVARIARVQRHGQTMWTAQLAGLTYHAAHQTCDAMAARGTSCHVLAPSTDHLAMLTGDSGT
jgi:hypothetical protein